MKAMRINVYKVVQVKESSCNYHFEGSINSPQSVEKLLNHVFDLSNQAVENFGIISLNTKNKVVGAHLISKGSLNQTIASPRDVFMNAMLNNASSIILFHNHPSGDSTPSKEDIEITKRMVECGELLGIHVLDHVIVGTSYSSLKEEGLM